MKSVGPGVSALLEYYVVAQQIHTAIVSTTRWWIIRNVFKSFSSLFGDIGRYHGTQRVHWHS
jgi:hypothetical protein